MLDIINQQGAQVEALKAKINELESILTLVANRFIGGKAEFTLKDIKAAQEQIESMHWQQNKQGKVTVTVERKTE